MITNINEFKKIINNNEFDYYKNNDKRVYYIIFEGIDYEISIIKNKHKDFNEYDYIGFKVKMNNEYFYDFDKIINTNNWSRFSKLLIDVIKYDFNNNNIKGYIFSTLNNKKGNQRMLLYKRLLNNMNCQIIKEYDNENKIIFTI